MCHLHPLDGGSEIAGLEPLDGTEAALVFRLLWLGCLSLGRPRSGLGFLLPCGLGFLPSLGGRIVFFKPGFSFI